MPFIKAFRYILLHDFYVGLLVYYLKQSYIPLSNFLSDLLNGAYWFGILVLIFIPDALHTMLSQVSAHWNKNQGNVARIPYVNSDNNMEVFPELVIPVDLDQVCVWFWWHISLGILKVHIIVKSSKFQEHFKFSRENLNFHRNTLNFHWQSLNSLKIS